MPMRKDICLPKKLEDVGKHPPVRDFDYMSILKYSNRGMGMLIFIKNITKL